MRSYKYFGSDYEDYICKLKVVNNSDDIVYDGGRTIYSYAQLKKYKEFYIAGSEHEGYVCGSDDSDIYTVEDEILDRLENDDDPEMRGIDITTDGSLAEGGVELRTPPFVLDNGSYEKFIKDRWEILGVIRPAMHAGIHIHVSRGVLIDEETVLVSNLPWEQQLKMILALSPKKLTSLVNEALDNIFQRAPNNYCVAVSLKRLLEHYKSGWCNYGRYRLVNIDNPKTTEIRGFKSTDRISIMEDYITVLKRLLNHSKHEPISKCTFYYFVERLMLRDGLYVVDDLDELWRELRA
jgi:hypothetical protein